jgi:Heterokaryon incompatibility protein (HET)
MAADVQSSLSLPLSTKGASPQQLVRKLSFIKMRFRSPSLGKRSKPNQIFEYTPLIANQIRLLTLLPDYGHKDSPLRCILTHVFLSSTILDEDSQYTAVSYDWGDDARHRKFEQSIYVESASSGACITGKLPIGQNAYDALRALRLQHKDRKVWLDQVCINQADYLERGAQVSLISHIYTLASSVIVWLGPVTNDSDWVLRQIKFSKKNPCSHPDHALRTRFLTGFAALMERPWFSRIWVIEEFSLPTVAPIFMCGGDGENAATWTQLWSVMQLFMEQGAPKAYNPSVQILQNPDATVWDTEEIRQEARLQYARNRQLYIAESHTGMYLHLMRRIMWRGGELTQQDKLASLVAGSRGFECSDRRDKVFALLGLHKHGCEFAIQPDYSKSWQQVYRETFAYILTVEKAPQLYVFFSLDKSRTVVEDEANELPSWCPDFRHQNRNSQDTPPFKERVVDVSLQVMYSRENPYYIEVSQDCKTLRMRGTLVGEITATEKGKFILDAIVSHYEVEQDINTAFAKVNDLHDIQVPRSMIAKKNSFVEKDAQRFVALLQRIERVVSLGSRGDVKGKQKVSNSSHAVMVKPITFREIQRTKGRPDPLIDLLVGDNMREGKQCANVDTKKHFQSLMDGSYEPGRFRKAQDLYNAAAPTSTAIRKSLGHGRTFFRLDNKLFGLGMPGTRVGDVVATFFGRFEMAFVLRPHREGDRVWYEMVGMADLPKNWQDTGGFSIDVDFEIK